MRMFKDYSDEELIKSYKDGNEAALDYLFEKYKNLVRKKAKAMFIVGGDNDDLIQEGMIGLYKAIRDYDETKEASFMTFASMCINRQMCTAVTTANRKKYSPLNSYVSLDMPVKSELEEESSKLSDVLHSSIEQNPEKLFIDRESSDSIESKLDKILSGYEQQVLLLQMEGLNYTDIAERLGKTPKSVDNALQRIRNKLTGIM